MDYKELIGYFAAILTTTSFIPQAFKTIQTKDTSGISKNMYFIIVLGTIAWLIYGLLTKNYPVILANIITSILTSIILILKLKHK